MLWKEMTAGFLTAGFVTLLPASVCSTPSSSATRRRAWASSRTCAWAAHRHFQLRLLSGPAAEAARDSIVGVLAEACRLGDATLAATPVRQAYVDGMSLVLGVCVVVALVGAVLVRRFMPAPLGP
jgi:hypothetical protein